jgi:hypothetical protein
MIDNQHVPFVKNEHRGENPYLFRATGFVIFAVIEAVSVRFQPVSMDGFGSLVEGLSDAASPVDGPE